MKMVHNVVLQFFLLNFQCFHLERSHNVSLISELLPILLTTLYNPIDDVAFLNYIHTAVVILRLFWEYVEIESIDIGLTKTRSCLYLYFGALILVSKELLGFPLWCSSMRTKMFIKQMNLCILLLWDLVVYKRKLCTEGMWAQYIHCLAI